MRGTVNVVTSPCADGMTGVLPTSTPESKRPLSSKCRDVLRHLDFDKSGPTAHGWMQKKQLPKILKSGHTAAKGSDHVVL